MSFSICCIILCIQLYISFIYSYSDKRLPIKLSYLNMLMFGIMCIFRSLNVPDTLVYVSAFKECLNSYSFLFERVSGFELGFSFLMRFCKLLVNDYHFFFLVCVLINIVLLIKTLDEFAIYNNFPQKYLELFLLLFLPFYGLYYWGIVLRGGLAMSFATYSLFLLLNEKKRKAIMMAILAILFHQTAVLFFIGLMFCKLLLRIKVKWYWILMSVLLVIYLSGLNEIVFSYVIGYIQTFIYSHELGRVYISYSGKVKVAGISLKVLFYFMIGYMCLFFYKFISPKMERLFSLYFLGLIIAVFFSEITAISRLSEFFLISYFYILISIYATSKIVVQRSLLYPACVGISTVNFCISIIAITNVFS